MHGSFSVSATTIGMQLEKRSRKELEVSQSKLCRYSFILSKGDNTIVENNFVVLKQALLLLKNDFPVSNFKDKL